MSDECKHPGELSATFEGDDVVFTCEACETEIKRMPYTLVDGKPTIQVQADTSKWRMVYGTNK